MRGRTEVFLAAYSATGEVVRLESIVKNVDLAGGGEPAETGVTFSQTIEVEAAPHLIVMAIYDHLDRRVALAGTEIED